MSKDDGQGVHDIRQGVPKILPHWVVPDFLRECPFSEEILAWR